MAASLSGQTALESRLFDPVLGAIGPDSRFSSSVAGRNRDETSAIENLQIYRDYRDGYGDYRAQMEDDFVFSRLGRQYTTAQEEALAGDFQAPLVFNHCRRIGEQYVSHVAGRTPRMTALPRIAGNRQVAQVLSDLLAYNWYISTGVRTLGIAVSDMIFRGCGYVYAFVDPNADYGRGDVRFEWLSPLTVYLDHATRDPFANTSEHAVVSYLIQRARAAQLHPDHLDVIQAAAVDTTDDDYVSSSRGTSIGSYGFAYGDRLSTDRDKLRIIDRYTRILQEMVMLLNPDTLEPIGLFERKEERKIRDFVAQWDRLVQDQFPGAGGIEIPVRRVNVWRVRHVTSLTTQPALSRRQRPGAAVLVDDVMPLDRYPVIPLFNMDTGNPFPPSEIRDLKQPQMFFNTMLSKLVKNVSGLAGGGRTFVHEESGAYEEMQQKQNLPNATILWRGEPHMKPIVEGASPVPLGLMELAMAGKSWMDGVSGMSESLQGLPGGDRESARLRSIRGEESSRRPDQKLKIVETALEELGRVLTQLNQAFYTGPKVFSLSDTAGEIRDFAINQGMATQGGFAGLPRHRAMTGEELYGSINAGAYAVVIAPGSTKPTNRSEQLQEAMAIGQIVASNPAVASMVLDAWDHPKADRYRAEFAQVAQLQQMIASLQKQLSESDRRLFVAENEAKRAREAKELEQLRADLETLMAQVKSRFATIEKGVAITAGQAEAQVNAEVRLAKERARAAAQKEKGNGEEDQSPGAASDA